MLKIYVYCSYRNSPEEFTLGAFDAAKGNTNDEYIFINKEEVKNTVISKILYSGMVKKAYGKIPESLANSGKYIYVIKDLRCEFTNEDNMPSVKYGNFAFETDEPEIFKKIFIKFENFKPVDLEKYLDKLVVPDVGVADFRLKIDAKEFNSFHKELMKNIGGNKRIKENFCIIASSGSSDHSSEISELIGTELVHCKDNIYRCKKKVMNLLIVIPILIILAMILLILLLQ